MVGVIHLLPAFPLLCHSSSRRLAGPWSPLQPNVSRSVILSSSTNLCPVFAFDRRGTAQTGNCTLLHIELVDSVKWHVNESEGNAGNLKLQNFIP